MIGAAVATASAVFGNPIVSTLVGFLPDAIEWVGNIRHHFAKSGRLDALVKEYVYLAEAAGCLTLAGLLRSQGIIAELDASCDGSKSIESIASQLLSNASIPEEERATKDICLQFVGDYFSAKTWISNEELKSATAIVSERLTSGFEGVNARLDQLGLDLAAQDHDTSLILDQIASGNLTYEGVRDHVGLHGRDSLTRRMLGLYCDLLDGAGLDSDSLATCGSFPGIATFFAGCLASTWRLDDLEQLASLIGGELREDVERIMPVLLGKKPLASVCEDSVLKGFHDDDFAMLCVAEFAYYARAFDVAVWHFGQLSKRSNEVAELHRRASELMVALMNTHVVPDDIMSLAESIPDGMAPPVVEVAVDAVNLGMALLPREDFESLYSGFDDRRKELCERASSWQRLEGSTAEEAWSILRMAERRGFTDVFLFASDRLIADPNEAEKVRRYWKGQTNALCDHYSLLEFYLSRVDPEISAEAAEYLVADKLDDPVYELTLAEHFANRDEGFFERCVERAVGAMKDETRGAVDIAHMHVWVPYLVERGRTDEILAILSPMGVMPERYAADLVSLLWRNGVDQSVIDGFIDDHSVWRHVSQPRSLYVLAAHRFNAGDYEAAVALGTKSFEGQATVQAARLVADAGNFGHQQVSRRIVECLVEDDKALSLYLAAGQYRIIGEDDLADNLLVRAVLLGGDGAAQSAAALVGEWAGGSVEKGALTIIGRDCAVAYVGEDGTRGTIVFHGSQRRVPNGRREVGDAIHLTTRSPEFTFLEGKGLGSTYCRRLGMIDVIGIETAEACLLRLCFRLMTELPDVTVLTLGDDPIGTISRYLKAREEATRPRIQLVRDGVKIEGGLTLYPGISTGAALLGQSRLEFAFRVSRDKRTPLRRAPESQASSQGKDEFLLSASALIMMAIVDFGQECEERLCRSCVVTETTSNLLKREAEIFRSQIDRSAGMLFLGADGRPVLVPMEEDERRARRVFVAKVLELLDRVRLRAGDEVSFANRGVRKSYPEIGANESQDWFVCEHDGLTYVTEDALEAVRIAADDAMQWCTLLQVMGALGASDLELSRCSVSMHRVGCDPCMGRSQALRAYDLLMRGRSLDEEERATLLNYVEATGFLDDSDDDGHECVKDKQ